MFQTIAEGTVFRAPGGDQAVAAGPRCAMASDGRILCSFMVQSKLGINDFVPTLAVSEDSGNTWQTRGPVWPHLRGSYSIFCSISSAPKGDLFLYGSRTPIDSPGESFWRDESQGMKANQLIWARSRDGGRTWCDPVPFDLPLPGAAECPGPLCVTRSGRWLGCYAPYRTFDPAILVKRNHVVLVASGDEGRTWSHTSMLRFDDPNSGGAEAWVIELSDGRLLGTCWHLNVETGSDHPNAFALSQDGGDTWSETGDTGIRGQSTSLAALPDGRALFVYNARKCDEPGVWMAVVRPSERDFGIESNEPVWRAQRTTQGQTSGTHADWQDFAFGEPAPLVLPDGTVLVTLWCIQPDLSGIRFVRLAPR